MKQPPSGPVLPTGTVEFAAQTITAGNYAVVDTGAAARLGDLVVASPTGTTTYTGLLFVPEVHADGYVRVTCFNANAGPVTLTSKLVVRWMVLPRE
jgi:hypothetical protein